MVLHHVTGLFIIIVLSYLLTCSVSVSDQSLISLYKIKYIFNKWVTRTKGINNCMHSTVKNVVSKLLEETFNS